MSLLYVVGFSLKLGHLLLAPCCWIISVIYINWFNNGGIMETKVGFLGGGGGKIWLKWWEKISCNGCKIHQYQCIGSKKVRRTLWRKLLLTWVLGWIMVSLWIFCFMTFFQATEKRKETLASMCDERARMLQDQFNVSMNHIQAMSILISTLHHAKSPSAIDQKIFARYTKRTAFERPLTSGIAYAVRVLHSEREQFEKQQGWTIKRIDTLEQNSIHEDDYAPKKLEPSPVPEYAPVLFAEETISHVISVDVLSGKEDRENVLRARELGKGVLTAPFRLLNTNHRGVILTFAVYNLDLPSNATPNERIQATNGYLGGVFDIESLVGKLLQQLTSKQTMIVNVYDTTNHTHPIPMYGSKVSDDELYHVSSLNFGDPFRKHEMHCRFKHKPPWPWLAIATSIGSLVFALLVGHIFHGAVHRIAKVEDDFYEMMELKKQAENVIVTSVIKQPMEAEEDISPTQASSFNTDAANNSIPSATNFSPWETEHSTGTAEFGAVSSLNTELVHQHNHDAANNSVICTSNFSQWEIRDPPIGSGGFAFVYVASNRVTGDLCAVKKLKNPDNLDNIRSLTKEIEILSQLEHPNIVKYYGNERVGNQIWLFMEYVDTGTLTKYISELGAFRERLVRDTTIQILSALAYLHTKRVVHRDIKPDNMLVDSYGFVKLIDFGMAKHVNDSMGSHSMWGTSHYAAPETLQNQEYSSSGEAYSADVWSLGCVIIEMFTGQRPWIDLDWWQVNREVCLNRRDPEIPQDLSKEGKEFLQLCFERNPAKRLSASQLLQHPFVS